MPLPPDLYLLPASQKADLEAKLARADVDHQRAVDNEAAIAQSAALATAAAGITPRANLAAISGADGYYRAMDTGYVYQRAGGSNTRRADLEALSYSGLHVVYPEQLGAVGDGVTDDTAALQAALNTTGQRIALRRGRVYGFSGPLTVSARVEIEANGATLKLLTPYLQSSGGAPLALQAGAAGSHITGLTLDLNNNSGLGIDHARNTSDVTWQGCTVRNVRAQGSESNARAVRVRDGCHNTTWDGGLISGVRMRSGAASGDGTVGRGILAADTQGNLRGLRVLNSTFEDIEPHWDGDGIVTQDFPGDVDALISGNTFRRCRKRAVKLQCPGARVIGNQIDGTYDAAQGQQMYNAVAIYANRTTVADNQITGVYFSAAIGLPDGVDGEDILISGNTVTLDVANRQSGHCIGNESGISTIKRLVISGNTLRGGQNGVQLRNNLRDVTITGNAFDELAKSAIELNDRNLGTAPTRVQVAGNVYGPAIAQYTVTTAGGRAPVSLNYALNGGDGLWGRFGGNGGGTGTRVAATTADVQGAADTATANLTAAQGGMKRRTLPQSGANGWTRLVRIQSVNPIDTNENTSFVGQLYAQPDRGNAASREYIAQFGFGVRDGAGAGIRPLLVEHGNPAGVSWRIYRTADGWHDLYVNVGTFTLPPSIDYTLKNGSEPTGAWTLSDPTADGTLTLVWDSTTGPRQMTAVGAVRFPVAQTAANTTNGTLFLDSADGKLKFKDASGVVNALY